MTRWVRSGNSQKHKKMPGNATKWGEFDNQYARKIPPKKKKNIDSETDLKQNFQSPSSSFPSTEVKESLNEDFFSKNKYCSTENRIQMNELESDIIDESQSNVMFSSTNDEQESNNFLIDRTQNTKMKKKKKLKNFNNKNSSLDEKTDKVDVNESKISKRYKQSKLENDCSVTSLNEMSDQHSDYDDVVENKISSEKTFLNPQSKMKRKKKMKKNFNKIDSENLLLDEKADINESEISKRNKQSKLENDCSITNPNEMPDRQSDDDDDKNRISPEKTFLKPQSKIKRKKKMKKNYNKIDSENLSANSESMETSFNNSDESLNLEKAVGSSGEVSEPNKCFQKIDQSSEKHKMNSDSNQASLDIDHSKNSSSKVFQNKKERYLKQLQKKREKLGLLLLPRNVENKLHKIQKKLKEKGFPPEKQKEIMRETRRKEELKYRKVFNPSKLCFGCREAGHILADCPKKSEALKQETGICFKCGSVEHTSFKCPEKVQGFPYATCFICKEKGHISRECPKNKHGVYPKGGRCKLCGNVNHLKKDCPTLKKKDNEEETVTLHTVSENASIDAEVVEKEEIQKKPSKKAKIVKF